MSTKRLLRNGDLRRPLPGRARDRKRRPSLEALEGRELMSLGAEFPAPINTTNRHAPFDADNASLLNGSSVVVWTAPFTLTDQDILAQRFNSAGDKVGPEIVVSSSSLNESEPAVAMDSQGDFVVSWTQTQLNGDTNVLARRFDSAGNPQGAIVPVGVGTFHEHASDVAMDSLGLFTVAYVRDTNNNNPDVFAKVYNAFGDLLNVVSVATTGRAETSPSIAMTPDGRFDVTWEDASSSANHDIKMNSYSWNGGLLGTYAISSSASNDFVPSVAVDNNFNAVVAWSRAGNGGSDVKARRVSEFGVMGPEIDIASSSALETAGSVAMNRSGGSFVVAYDSSFSSTLQVKVAEVSASNAVTTFDAGEQRFGGAVSINGFNNYMLTYTARDGIRGRRGHLA